MNEQKALVDLQVRLARLEPKLIESKSGLPGYEKYLRERLNDKSLSPTEVKEFESMLVVFEQWTKRYYKQVKHLRRAIRDLESAKNQVSNLLSQSESMARNLRNREEINREEQSIVLSPSLEGSIVLKELNAKVRIVLSEMSEEILSIQEKMEGLLKN